MRIHIKIEKKFQDISLSKTFSGEGIIINNNKAKGVIIKGVNKDEKNVIRIFKK